jgi:hypothetical protein
MSLTVKSRLVETSCRIWHSAKMYDMKSTFCRASRLEKNTRKKDRRKKRVRKKKERRKERERAGGK